MTDGLRVAVSGSAMAGFARMGTMEVWYAHLAEDEFMKAVRSAAAEASKTKKGAKVARRAESPPAGTPPRPDA